MEKAIAPTVMEGPNGEKSRLRVLLEMSGFELSGPRGLADFIPVVRCSEVAAVLAAAPPHLRPPDDITDLDTKVEAIHGPRYS